MRKRNTPESLWQRLTPNGECREWSGYRLPGGYGRTTWHGIHVYSHRLAWELSSGPIPDDLWVLHHCDNPPCCRPEHLYLGTPADNAHDREIRQRGSRGEHQPKSLLTERDIPTIFAMAGSGKTQREIGATFHVSQGAIWKVLTRQTWRHINPAASEVRP